MEVSVILATVMPFTERDVGIKNVVKEYISCGNFLYEKIWV